MLVIADAHVAAGGRRRDGRRGVGGLVGHAARGLRERLLRAGVGPPHEQAPRPQDRGLVALRARHRHQRARSWPSSARARCIEQIGAGRRVGELDRRLPGAARARSTSRLRRASIDRLLGTDRGRRRGGAHLHRPRVRRRAGGRRLALPRPDQPRGHARARRTSSRRWRGTTATTGCRRTSPRCARPRRGPTRGSRARTCCATC